MFWEILIELVMNEVGIIGVFVFFSEILFVFILNYRGIDES